MFRTEFVTFKLKYFISVMTFFFFKNEFSSSLKAHVLTVWMKSNPTLIGFHTTFILLYNIYHSFGYFGNNLGISPKHRTDTDVTTTTTDVNNQTSPRRLWTREEFLHFSLDKTCPHGGTAFSAAVRWSSIWLYVETAGHLKRIQSENFIIFMCNEWLGLVLPPLRHFSSSTSLPNVEMRDVRRSGGQQ